MNLSQWCPLIRKHGDIAGFIVDRFIEMQPSTTTLNAASIYVYKGGVN